MADRDVIKRAAKRLRRSEGYVRQAFRRGVDSYVFATRLAAVTGLPVATFLRGENRGWETASLHHTGEAVAAAASTTSRARAHD